MPEPVPDASAGAGDGVGSSVLGQRDMPHGLRLGLGWAWGVPPAIEWHSRKPSSESEPSAG